MKISKRRRNNQSKDEHAPTTPVRRLSLMESAIVITLRDSLDPEREEVTDLRAGLSESEDETLTYNPGSSEGGDWKNTFLDWFNELTRDPVEAQAFVRGLRSVADGFESDAKYYFGKEWPEPGPDPPIKQAYDRMREACARFIETYGVQLNFNMVLAAAIRNQSGKNQGLFDPPESQ